MPPLPRRTRILAVTTLVLNSVDAISTYLAVTRVGAVELNPIMAAVISFSPTLFLFGKIIIGVLLIALAMENLDEKRFFKVMIGPAILLTLIALSHVVQWILVFWS